MKLNRLLSLFLLVSTAAGTGCSERNSGRTVSLLNVSADSTRGFYRDFNAAFAREWLSRTGQTVTIEQSFGPSGRQVRAVQAGLDADVVTLGSSDEIETLVQAGLVAPNWQRRLPNRGVPFTSPLVFLVRHGNPLGIKDWLALVKPGIVVVAPNPKSSSAGRWCFLAAYGQALRQPGGSPETAQAYVTRLSRNVPVLDSGSHAAAVNFTQHETGDVLLTTESEARLIVSRRAGATAFEIVTPRFSLQTEPAVAVVDRNALAHHTRAVATAYVEYLYSVRGQEIAAKNFFRPLRTGREP